MTLGLCLDCLAGRVKNSVDRLSTVYVLTFMTAQLAADLPVAPVLIVHSWDVRKSVILAPFYSPQDMNLVGRGGGPSLAAQTSLRRLSDVKMGSHQAKVILNPNNHTYESEETEVVKITVSGRSISSARFLSKVHHILPALHEDESWKTKYLSDCSQNTNVPLSETNESQYTSESEARMIEGVDILAHLGCSPKSKNILKTDDRTYNEYSIIESDQSNNRVTPEEEMSDNATQTDPTIPRGQTSRLHQKDSCINRTERPSDNVHASKIQSTLSFSAHETLSLRDRLAQIEGLLATQNNVLGATLDVVKSMAANVPSDYFNNLKSDEILPASDEEPAACGSRRCSFQLAVDNQIQQELSSYLEGR